MSVSRFSGLLLMVGLLAGCSVFHRRGPAPALVVEAPPPPPPVITPPKAAADLADAMTTVLRLLPDQTARVRQVLRATVAEANAASQQFAPGSPALTAAQRRINLASDRQLRQILGPVKYRELQTRRPQVQALMRGQ